MKGLSKKSAINLGVILCISIACTFYFAGLSSNLSDILLNVLYGIIVGLSIAVGSSLISKQIFKSEKVYENPTKYFVLAILSVATYIIADVVLVNYLWFSITQGVTLSEIFGSTYGVYAIASEFIIGLLIYLVMLARFFTRDLQKYYSRVSEIESQLSKYRYDTLKNQLNPHFLFNTLNTLSGLIHIDVDRADEFIHRLSKLYRYVLEVQRVEVVTIATEVELAKDYLYLNNIRFNDQIKASFSLEASMGYVVPMALQLLIENAIKHNKIGEKSPLIIEVFAEEDCIFVRNNIQLKEEKEPSHQLGLRNLQERYAVLTNRELIIDRTEKHFTVCIPILKQENE